MDKTTQRKTACFTGHRDVPEDRVSYVKNELRREIGEAVADGYEHFISGFAEGVDLLAAEIVLELQKDWPSMTLEAAIPYRGRLEKLKGSAVTAALLHGCSDVNVYCEDYTTECHTLRNRSMVDKSGRVIAIYDGREKGGTAQTIRYADALSRDLRLVCVSL